MRLNHWIACNELCVASKHCMKASTECHSQYLEHGMQNVRRLSPLEPFRPSTRPLWRCWRQINLNPGCIKQQARVHNKFFEPKKQKKANAAFGMCWVMAAVFPGLRDRWTSWTGITVTFLTHIHTLQGLLSSFFFFSLTQVFSMSLLSWSPCYWSLPLDLDAKYWRGKKKHPIERKKLPGRPVWLCSQSLNDGLSRIISTLELLYKQLQEHDIYW